MLASIPRPSFMSSRGAGGLPSGWKEATAADGRTYYFHAASGETSWERPMVSGSEDSGKSTAALAVKVKPVIPSVPTTAGIGKLPNGWRMVSSPEGKPYYFNKKTGETLWERPAGYEEDDSADTLGLEKATLSVKDGWRRTKQVAAATVGLGRPTGSSDDAWLDGQYEQVLQVERQMLGLKQMCEAYAKSLVDVMRSSEQLATKFGEYLVEPGAVGTEPARQSAAVWKEVNKIGQRSLEVQFTSKVLQPLAGYLGEIEGIKKLHAEHLKKKLDFEYYRRKVDELTFRPPKDAAKLPRNAEKLREREADHWNCKNELIARLAALIAEKWDFANAPLLHLLEFQQRFHTQMSEGMRSLSAFTYEGALLDAEARQMSRQTLRTEALASPVEAKPLASYLPQAPAAYCGAPPPAPQPSYSVPPPHPSYASAPPPHPSYASAPPPHPSYAAAPPPHPSYAAAPPPHPSYASAPPPQPSSAAPPPQPSSAAPPPAPPPLRAPPHGEQMRAIGDYISNDPRMISFSAGELMLKEKEEDGWFFGSVRIWRSLDLRPTYRPSPRCLLLICVRVPRCSQNSRGETGYFPPNYVEPVPYFAD